MHALPPPSSRDLLPPLLACLPTSFVSPRPPPALLPLLAPVLRQRVNYLADNTGANGWLPLLSWDADRAAKLPAVVRHMDLEPHPVSGELEIEDLRPAKYRRLDEETVHARLEAEQFDLAPIYVWCEKDEHGGTEPGWKLAELRVLEDMEDGTEWHDSPPAANAAAVQSAQPSSAQQHADPTLANGRQEQEQEEDNDDYWAAYDRTPGHTPAPASAQPNPHSMNGRQMADASYYARYGAEVQPALDSHDPDEEGPVSALGGSTARGDSPLTHPHPQATVHHQFLDTSSRTLKPTLNGDADHLSMPRPISPTSSHSSVEKLEEQAEAMSASTVELDRGQRAIKMHISTDIKSLFRLAKSSGMDRVEFQEVVRRELDVLSLLEADE